MTLKKFVYETKILTGIVFLTPFPFYYLISSSNDLLSSGFKEEEKKKKNITWNTKIKVDAIWGFINSEI